MTGPLFSIPMIERFIGFDTISRNSNLPLIHFVRDYLADLGIESILTHDETGEKANLFATLGPKDKPGIVLSGHTDVVPCEDQIWTSDPFTLSKLDDRVVGRGVCDMKGFLAIATAFAPVFADLKLHTPIHLAMSFDEEVGCLGVPLLLEDLKKRNIAPLACIVGEPSGMGLIRANKGKIGGHITVSGLPVHSGLAHLGVNAVEAAAEAIAKLKQIQRRHRDDGPHNSAFEEPTYTTIQTCVVQGGTAVNIVAAQCSFDFDIRYLPGENPMDYVNECRSYVEKHIEPEMKITDTNAGFKWEFVPGCLAFNTPEDSEVMEMAKALSGHNSSTCVGFGTEAGHFQDAGIPTIICGPGSIDQAHKADEFLTHEQIVKCEKFLWKLVDRVSVPK